MEKSRPWRAGFRGWAALLFARLRQLRLPSCALERNCPRRAGHSSAATCDLQRGAPGSRQVANDGINLAMNRGVRLGSAERRFARAARSASKTSGASASQSADAVACMGPMLFGADRSPSMIYPDFTRTGCELTCLADSRYRAQTDMSACTSPASSV